MDDVRGVQRDRVGAEADIGRNLGDIEPDARLEPDPLGVDQRDRRHRRGVDDARHLGDAIEHRLARRIEHPVTRERGQPRRFPLGAQRPPPGATHRFIDQAMGDTLFERCGE